jgi:hypothetical protein
MRQIKAKMLQTKIEKARKAAKLKEEAKKQAYLEEIRKERPHPLSSFITSTPDLLSTPFDYESAMNEQLKALHSTDHIEQRIEEVDSKLAELKKHRLARSTAQPISELKSSQPTIFDHHPKEDTQEAVSRWMKDRRERALRQERRLANQQALQEQKFLEEIEAKRRAEELKMKIKVAQSEARIHAMNQERVMRAEMHRYQTKVVTQLINQPRSFYFYQASGEALDKVRQKLQGYKLGSHKVKLDDQISRLGAVDTHN